MAKPNESGFTFIEILVAAVLMTTVAAGLLRAFVTARGLTPAQVARSANNYLATQKLEDLHEAVRQDWWNESNRPLTPGTTVEPAVAADGSMHTRTTTVGAVNNGQGSDYRSIEVTVT